MDNNVEVKMLKSESGNEFYLQRQMDTPFRFFSSLTNMNKFSSLTTVVKPTGFALLYLHGMDYSEMVTIPNIGERLEIILQ